MRSRAWGATVGVLLATGLHQVAGQCGTDAFMHAATHPSRVDYMAATSGVPTGVGVHTADDDVFHQATAHGDTWRAYEESMPEPCGGNSGATRPATARRSGTTTSRPRPTSARSTTCR